jgi:hypothetical protein
MEADMRHSISLAAALTCALVSFASAQNNLQNNMATAPYQQVAPLAPPQQATPSPLLPNLPGSWNMPSSPNLPGTPSSPRETFGDRTTRCLHYGATQGLTGGDLAAYSRSCANN